MNKKVILITLAIMTTVVFVFIAAFFGLLLISGAFPCGDEIKSKQESPDHTKVVIVEEQNCGATTPFEDSVKIHQNGWLPITDKTIFFKNGQATIKVEWVGNKVLKIKSSDFDRVLTKEGKFEDIRIIYEQE